jgi:hypothetical protein
LEWSANFSEADSVADTSAYSMLKDVEVISSTARVRVALLRLQVPFAVLRPQSHGGALENLRQMHIMEQQITTDNNI